MTMRPSMSLHQLCNERCRVCSLLSRSHLQTCRNRNELRPLYNIMSNERRCSSQGRTMMTSWSFTKQKQLIRSLNTCNLHFRRCHCYPLLIVQQRSIHLSCYVFHDASLPLSSASDEVRFLRPAIYHESQMLLHDQSS